MDVNTMENNKELTFEEAVSRIDEIVTSKGCE